MSKKWNPANLLIRMHPLQRILLSVFVAALVWFFVKNIQQPILLTIISTWCAFAFIYVITSWIVMFSRKVEQIKKMAKEEDGSKIFVIIFTVVASIAAMVTVLLLVISSGNTKKNELLTVLISFFSVMLSWILVHTILTFHYAHMYYDDDASGKKQHREGLNFPEDEAPNYLDFAYFSFVIGMTFQVSDVEVTDKKIRRLVLLHGLISFLLNTFVVALTINFIAGLSK
ncbi:MAG: DUF1345 domain-containing protein [Ferruginibacter sp.]|nr:DUF1345 domain-containing protein [Ferruginibacter sp.]